MGQGYDERGGKTRIRTALDPIQQEMLKLESQMCARYGFAGSGVWRATRLNQRVIDDVQLRDGSNFNISYNGVSINVYLILFILRPLFASLSQVASVMKGISLPP